MYIKYAHEICKNMDSICINMQQKYAKIRSKICKICRSPYFAYFASYICTPHINICTPHFVDVIIGSLQFVGCGELPRLHHSLAAWAAAGWLVPANLKAAAASKVSASGLRLPPGANSDHAAAGRNPACYHVACAPPGAAGQAHPIQCRALSDGGARARRGRAAGATATLGPATGPPVTVTITVALPLAQRPSTVSESPMGRRRRRPLAGQGVNLRRSLAP